MSAPDILAKIQRLCIADIAKSTGQAAERQFGGVRPARNDPVQKHRDISLLRRRKGQAHLEATPDRAVKQFIRTHSTEVYDRRAPFAPVPKLALKDLGRIKPSGEDVGHNPRARSAVMRVAQRTAEG